MTYRKVTHTQKSLDGDILYLSNPREEWSPVSKADAIYHIQNNLHIYYTSVDGFESLVVVRNGHLTTEPNRTKLNNLAFLPDFSYV